MFELVLRAPQALVEPVSEALMGEHEALSVSVEDADAGSPGEQALFGEPGLPAPAAGWDRSTLKALFETEAEAERAATLLLAQAGTQGLQVQALAPLAEQDWVQLTQSQFAPVAITPGFWIVPSWHEPPAAARHVIRLDPGLAFGTGTHPTTALCLEWLDGLDLRARCVVDYGCGSGILAIAALLLGAASAIAIDNDPQALTATLANAERNGVSDRLRVLAADDAADLPAGSADVVVANILAGPLIALAPRLLTLLRPGGQIALSGLIRSQQDDVEQAYRAALTLDPVAVREEDWCRVSGQKTRGDTQNA